MVGHESTLPRADRRRELNGSGALVRVAGYGALGAIATLVVAGVALAIFFSDTEALAVFGPINDIFTAATLILIVPAVIVVWRTAVAGQWFGPLSAVTVGGMLLAAAGLVLLVVRVIDLQGSFVIGGIGILPFLVWLAALAYLALNGRVLSRRVGWWALALLGSIALAVAAAPFVSMATLSITIAPVLLGALAIWLYVLGRDLLAESAGEGATDQT
jgi:hypothetical protein